MRTTNRAPTVSISVIVATLNSEKDLPRLLRSLDQQTDKDFDLIVVDGGSRDRTRYIVESHRELVTTRIFEPDYGIYDALNKGISASGSDFYLVLGADDILFTDAVAQYKAEVNVSAPDVVIASVRAGGKIRSGFRRNRAWLGHSAMITSHSVGMLIRKTLHETFGKYSLRYPLLADGLFIKRVCTANDVKIVTAAFVAGEFGMKGASNRNLARALFESWQIQLDTGENPFVQYLLFQLRLIRYLPAIIADDDSQKARSNSPS